MYKHGKSYYIEDEGAEEGDGDDEDEEEEEEEEVKEDEELTGLTTTPINFSKGATLRLICSSMGT